MDEKKEILETIIIPDEEEKEKETTRTPPPSGLASEDPYELDTATLVTPNSGISDITPPGNAVQSEEKETAGQDEVPGFPTLSLLLTPRDTKKSLLSTAGGFVKSLTMKRPPNQIALSPPTLQAKNKKHEKEGKAQKTNVTGTEVNLHEIGTGVF